MIISTREKAWAFIRCALPSDTPIKRMYEESDDTMQVFDANGALIIDMGDEIRVLYPDDGEIAIYIEDAGPTLDELEIIWRGIEFMKEAGK